ncbi:MAG: DEAD/DEAH box helicase [Bryobacteraceae bacterium]|nr:DEAD/DEAH box helicase [Bryobacteraceae bacterium]
MGGISVGSIVKCRNREWVVLPSPDEELYLLRPLAGSEHETIGIHSRLAALDLDRIEPAHFPLPNLDQAGDAMSVELLFNAARLTLRDGAGPFRLLGHISVRPRPYQFVPLLMALRLDPVRMLIADDVGIGKTVEALLIAREMLDRGETTRICVLCPPYLCSQWQQELWDKFRIQAVVIRSGTISQLERELPSGDHSIFGYYPHIVVSIDYAKSDAHRANFLQHAPKLVIVDEAHGATAASSGGKGQQQRHELLCDLAKDRSRHLILLTATPHSGVEAGFLSLLGLLKDEFRSFNLTGLKEAERIELARHFVQRKRGDVTTWLGEETPFPKRDPEDKIYSLSTQYKQLFEDVYVFSRELVRSGETLTGWGQRIRFWTALALLRCVMSSPAAAIAAIGKRLATGQTEAAQDDSEYSPYIFESADDDTVDVQPGHVVEEGEAQLSDPERRRLHNFARQAKAIKGTDADTKIVECTRLVADMLREGYHPIIWCRYIATSDYVRDELKRRLSTTYPNLCVLSITGALAEDERRALIDHIDPVKHSHRVLVATDCLSEGINLQRLFNAVIHYDLPWNPNRLEQREGRVDRFGQPSRVVKAVLFYGRDNPVDGAVLDVLLRKAREIYKTLGVRVPVPVNSETVMEAVLKRLFAQPDLQMSLFGVDEVQDIHRKWERAATEEKASRTRFAQHAIKPDEVERELAETDAVLADPSTAQRFLENAAQRVGLSLRRTGDTLLLSGFANLPEPVQWDAPRIDEWKVSFNTAPPEGVEYIDRNHPFLQSLAQWLMEQALSGEPESAARRCGAIRTTAVEVRTWLLLCRLRYTITTPGAPDLLAEEVRCFGFSGSPGPEPAWLPPEKALDLLRTARPDANISPGERRETLEELLRNWEAVRDALEPLVIERAKALETAHRRVRASVQLARRGMSVARHFPPDLLGVLVLVPVPKGLRLETEATR